MTITYTAPDGTKQWLDAYAVVIDDCEGNTYYLDDSTMMNEEDENLFIYKDQNLSLGSLYPIWVSYEKQRNYYQALNREQKIDDILND
jgi:hypothetical protein